MLVVSFPLEGVLPLDMYAEEYFSFLPGGRLKDVSSSLRSGSGQ